mmetsp:Transcript_13113/g.37862  ORF Transcript_13113/g.37862 Transcript_13113/m.37862 type:complete len:803 (+) Transcript_13113:1759-4167(+)
MSETNINTSTGVVPRETDGSTGSGRVVSVVKDSEAFPGELLGPTVVVTDRMASAELQDRIEKVLLMGPEAEGGDALGADVGADVGADGGAITVGGTAGVHPPDSNHSNHSNGPNPINIPSIAAIKPEDIHVLVVDDELMSRTVASTLLKRFKYTVTTAEDGAEAMELLKSAAPGTYHLVLTDVRMPQMDGIELLQYIRSEETLRSVPVVMMSSFDQGDVVCACEEGGAEEYLVKPVTQKEVANIWQHVLRKRGEATTVPQFRGEAPRAEQTNQAKNQHRKEREQDPQEQQRQQQQQQQQEEQEREHQEKHREQTHLMRSLREQSTITGEFLKMMREKRVREFEQLKEQVMLLQEDCEAVSCLSERDVVDGGEDGTSEGPTRKRMAVREPSVDLTWLNGSQLDASYFAKIHRSTPQVESFNFDGGGNVGGNFGSSGGVDPGPGLPNKSNCSEEDLREFATSLNAVSQRNKLVVESTIRSGNMANPQEMVCYSDFSVDDAHFATVSVSRSVKVFDHASIVESPDSLQFPVWQATTRFKLSSVSWNSYLRSHLITSDYGGAIQLWDVASGMKNEMACYSEHDKRVWSIDFSTLDPMQFASASDDATVRLWSLSQSNSSVSTIKLPANACSVSYNPKKATMLSVACANHACYVFDTRRTDRCVAMLGGATRAVSYVKWLGSDAVLGASTDSAIRSWDLTRLDEGVCEPNEVYRGHVNERNFVGLSVDGDGYVATGSEDNSVVVYYHKFPFSVCRWGQKEGRRMKEEGERGGGSTSRAFTSSVCWARGGRSLLVGNSEGCLALLKLV